MKTVNVFLLFYNLLWTVGIIFSLPLAPFVRKWRYAERLGFGLPSFQSGNKRIWVHALSVGEVISAIPVVKALKEKYPSIELVFTVKTLQGLEIARSELRDEVDFLIPMPLDFWWSTRQIIKHINPIIFVLVETDIWPCLIYNIHKRGAKIILVNGRISSKTFLSYKRFSFIARRMLGLFDKCLMQSDLDRDRLLEIGISRDIVETTGNIKYDRSWRPMDEKERLYWFSELKISPEDRLWVAGSTHKGEEKVIFETFKKISRKYPGFRLLIAPRRIERSEEVLKIGSEMDLDISMRTNIHEGYQVLILNTLGELGRVYGLAEISFVGGSLVPTGGHNLLEPASFGCPVVFGPHTQNFVLMAQDLEEVGGGICVQENNLFDIINGILWDSDRSKHMGVKAREFVEMNKGALNRVMDFIGRYIKIA